MSSDKPRGYLTRLLGIDCETSGLFFNGDNPALGDGTQGYYQAVSWGLVVINAETLQPIEKLYLEVKWDGKSIWSPKAEAVHGLSKAHLEEHGVSRTEAVEEIGNLILNHWGPSSPVCVLGHNPSFDLSFLKADLRSEGLEVRFGSKVVDTNSIGFAVFNTHNSDDLFELVGVKRGEHNALDDALAALKVVQTVRKLSDRLLGG